MRLTQPLHKGLSEHPQATALVCGGERLAFARLVERVSRLAGALRKLGMRAGDRVGMMGLNSHRFVEYFFADRWYNIFAIYDRDDGKIKGWYCNIGMPALIEDGLVSYVDLALDLWAQSEPVSRHLAFGMDRLTFEATFGRIPASGTPYGDSPSTPTSMRGPGRSSGVHGETDSVYFHDPSGQILEILTYDGER